MDFLIFKLMAKQRMIQTKFWSDTFIQSLSIEEKLFYLYLLTNEHTDICGVYEISKTTMSFESGLSMDRLSKTMDRLSKTGRILYLDGWIYIKNWEKHQLNNPKVIQGIKIGLSKVPSGFSEQIAAYNSLSIDYDRLSHSNLNSNLNSNSNTPLPPEGDDEGFEKFWKEYPKKVGKEPALKSFKKLSEAEKTKVHQSLLEHCKLPQWLKDDGQYIPNPATWINQKRFDDVLGGKTNDVEQNSEEAIRTKYLERSNLFVNKVRNESSGC